MPLSRLKYAGELRVLGLEGQRARRRAQERRNVGRAGRRWRRLRPPAEMRRNVALGAEQSLLLAAPEADADRALRLDSQSLQDAHGLHGHDRSRAVVRRAGAAVPGVEVGAEHDDFALLVRARDLGDRVPLHLVFFDEADLHVELELDVSLLLEQPDDPAEVLGVHHEVRDALRIALLVGPAALHGERAPVVRALRHDGQRLLVGKELVGGPAHVAAPQELLAGDVAVA